MNYTWRAESALHVCDVPPVFAAFHSAIATTTVVVRAITASTWIPPIACTIDPMLATSRVEERHPSLALGRRQIGGVATAGRWGRLRDTASWAVLFWVGAAGATSAVVAA